MQDKPIRVLQIIRTMNVGGAETFIMNVYRNIDREKVQFDFLVNNKGVFDEEIKKMGGKIFYIDYITEVGQLRYKRLLSSFFKEHNEYQIIHSHIDQVSGIILEVAKKEGISNRIAHSHSTRNTNNILGKIYKSYLQGKINKNATMLLACGIDAAKWLYKKEWKKSIIINNGIDIEKYKFSVDKRNKIREQLQVKENVDIIGHVGRFSKVKNQKFLIKVYKQYQKKNPNSLLIMVGIGEEKKKIETLVKKYGLERKVKFLGLRQDTDAIYSAMDYMVFPSLYEGISIALIEAQISGLKIFASDTIDKDTDISNNITWLSINDNPVVWSEEILNSRRQRNLDDINFLEYDIKNTARNLQNIYVRLGE